MYMHTLATEPVQIIRIMHHVYMPLATEPVQIIRIVHYVYMHTLLVINDTCMHILNHSMARMAWGWWATKRSCLW
jgi:hypothetical protein